MERVLNLESSFPNIKKISIVQEYLVTVKHLILFMLMIFVNFLSAPFVLAEPPTTSVAPQGETPLPATPLKIFSPDIEESNCAVPFADAPRHEWPRAVKQLEWHMLLVRQALKKFEATQGLGGTRDLLKWAAISAAVSGLSGMTGHNAQGGEDLITYYMEHDPMQVGVVFTASVAIGVLARYVYVKLRPGQTRRQLQRALNHLNSSLDQVLASYATVSPALVHFAKEIKETCELALQAPSP